MPLKTYYHESQMSYDGTQLQSHFAYKNFNLCGDSIVAFSGPCHVLKNQMVDLEDVKQNLFIYSENMLHFIVEHFDDDLIRMIAFQRLLVDNIIEELVDIQPELKLIRRGDDIFDDVCKLSVSIATASPISHLIHVGINISSKDTPVPTKGLQDYGINPHAVAIGCMNRYRSEIESIRKASAKVRACL